MHFWKFSNCPSKTRRISKFSKITRVIYPKNYLNQTCVNQQTLCIETNPDIFIIRNPDIFIIRGIFETLKYSKCLSKIFPGYNYFLLNAPSRRSRSQMFFKIGVLKYFAIFTGKHLRWSPFSIMLPTRNFIKKRHQHRCFPVNIANILRTTSVGCSCSS